MQSITLKRSTIAAMNQAYRVYCQTLDRMPEEAKKEIRSINDFNSFILMGCCERIVRMTSGGLSAGEFLQKVVQISIEFAALDKLDE